MDYSDRIKRAADKVGKGACIIYPTETLYALGGSALDAKTAARICKLKSRPRGKPLPVVIGEMEQLYALTEANIQEFSELMDKFWPGPLSILVKGRRDLPSQIRDTGDMVCVRWSSGYIASQLCKRAKVPLIASSANKDGDSPPVLARDLDPGLTEQVDHVLTQEEEGGNNLPSTIVNVLDGYKLQVIREGAISRESLERSGYTVVPV